MSGSSYEGVLAIGSVPTSGHFDSSKQTSKFGGESYPRRECRVEGTLELEVDESRNSSSKLESVAAET